MEPNARLQLKGHLPTTNTDTINSLITRLNKTLIWESTGSGAAGSGDLGYTYGLLRMPGTPDGTKGHYVRIWKKLPGDNWKIELEMMNFD
jgi:ketosteroid isomerase-like protein